MSGETPKRRVVRTEEVVPTTSSASLGATLRYFLLGMFVLLSWFATFTGMNHYILGPQGSGFSPLQGFIMLATAALMLMIVWLLVQLFSSDVHRRGKLVLWPAYLLLTAISVGFGFGFYWDLTRSTDNSHQQVEATVKKVRRALIDSRQQFSLISESLGEAAKISRKRAEVERETGNSCGNGSARGPGPIMDLRNQDAGNLQSWRVTVQKMSAKLRDDIEAVEQGAERLLKLRSATQSDDVLVSSYREFNKNIDDVRAYLNTIESRTDLGWIRNEMAQRAGRTEFPTFTCVDKSLSNALHQTVGAIDGLQDIPETRVDPPTLGKSISEAIGRLLGSFSSIFDSAEDQADRPRLESGDALPLIISLFVDFSILLLSAPWRKTTRLDPNSDEEAQRIERHMRDAYAGLTGSILQNCTRTRGGRTFVIASLHGSAEEMGLQRALSAVTDEKLIDEVAQIPASLQADKDARVFEFKRDIMPRLLRILADQKETQSPRRGTTTRRQKKSERSPLDMPKPSSSRRQDAADDQTKDTGPSRDIPPA